jgi:beta-lactamase regulating signal transducer with metallopeptidase domain
MNSVFSLLPEGGWQRLLCDAIWQSTLIAGLGFLAVRFLIRQSAARAWLLLLTLAACAVVPLASIAARQSGWGLLSHSESTSGIPLSADNQNAFTELAIAQSPEARPFISQDLVAAEAQTPDAVEIRSPNPESSAPAAPTASEFRHFPPWGYLAAIWLLASAILSARLTVSAIATYKLLSRAQSCDNQSLLAAAAEATRRVGLSRTPAILISPSIETPTIFCLGRTRLLIPTAREQQNANIRAAAFTHELAHVARRDGWSRLLVELIAIALPLQPLIWLARRAFRTACEEACDDWAVATGTSAVDLAETLTTWAKTKTARTALVIGMSSTKARTLRLLALHETPKARIGRSWRLASIFVAFSLAAGLAVAQTSKSEEKAANSSASSPDPQVKVFSIEKGDVNSLIAMLQKLFEGGTPPPRFAADPRPGSIIASGPANDLAIAEAILTKLETRDARASSDTTFAHPPAGSSVTGKAATGTQQSEEAIQKLLSQDSLVILYARQLADRKKEWDKAKAEGKDEDKAWSDQCLVIQEKLDKRKAEIRPRIVEELTEEHSRSHPQQADASRQNHATSPTYVIEPPDILTLEAMQLVPKKPVRIAPFDKLKIAAEGTLFDAPLSGTFQVDSEGEVVLGAAYGAVKLTGLTRREAEEAVTSKLQEKLKEPQVALIIDESRLENGIKGDHLVEPDGTINLGAYGQAYVAGMTSHDVAALRH